MLLSQGLFILESVWSEDWRFPASPVLGLGWSVGVAVAQTREVIKTGLNQLFTSSICTLHTQHFWKPAPGLGTDMGAEDDETQLWLSSEGSGLAGSCPAGGSFCRSVQVRETSLK